MEPFDVVVVGSGAAGGWAAKELTERGLRVLVLEAGRALEPGTDLGPNTWSHEHRLKGLEPEWVERQPVQSTHGAFHRYTRHLYVDDLDNPYVTPAERPFRWIRSRQVGGRTPFWGRVTLRHSDYELKAASRDGHGVDWPFGAAELAPCYARVEEFLGARGNADGLPQLPDGHCRPALPMTDGEQRLRALVERRWPERRLIMSRGLELEHRDGWPAFSSQASTLAAAAATGRLTLQPDAVVAQVLLEPGGRRARGVVYYDRVSHERHEVRARAVMLCASSIESTRLLMLSEIPDSSGALGRYLMDHFSISVAGVVPELAGAPIDPAWTGPASVYIPRFRNLERRDAPYLRGFGIWGGVQRRITRCVNYDGVPFMLMALGEMLPRAENRVTLDATGRDAWGLPVASIDCGWSENERAMAADAYATLREIADAAGYRILESSPELPAPGMFIHEVGTARMGTDPATSVLDPFCRSWAVSNLFVADGAGFPSIGWQNHTLTLMALAVRSSAHLADCFRRGDL